MSARLSSFSLTCSLCSYDVRHEPGTAADEAAMLHDGFSQQPPTRQKLKLFAGSAGSNKEAINAHEKNGYCVPQWLDVCLVKPRTCLLGIPGRVCTSQYAPEGDCSGDVQP